MTASITRSVQENEAGKRVDQLLTALDEIVSRAQAQRLIKSGNVLLNRKTGTVRLRGKYVQDRKFQLQFLRRNQRKFIPEKGVLDIFI